jgi:hypothetical protein
LEDRKALLSYLACGSVNIYLKEVAEYLLEGELKSKITNIMLAMILGRYKSMLGPETERRHEVLRVVLKPHGQKYAVDVAGAQYGYYQPVVEWDEFVKAQVVGYQFLSFTKDELRRGFEKKNCDQLAWALFLLQAQATKDLVEWVELVRLPPAEFEVREIDLVRFIKDMIRLDPGLVHAAFEMIKSAEEPGASGETVR